jgi:S1-C subfamily serine protease
MTAARGRAAAALALLALAGVGAGCGGSAVPLGGSGGGGTTVLSPPAPIATRTTTTRIEVLERLAAHRFDPSAIYAADAPGVVTVVSVFGNGGIAAGDAGLGSGFVVSADGQIATNAHVVSTGTGTHLKRAKQVYAQFGDGNQVPARIIGVDPDSDVGLISVDPAGLTLRPLTLGTTRGLAVGAPVAAIGSPFGEAQSLSVGVISATNRSIESLNSSDAGTSGGSFAISGAIQTDAAINHGNSGGPLVDAEGRVIGVNSQIQSTGGGGEGVGFAIPIDAVKRSLAQLRAHGSVAYAWLGVSTVAVFPQLAQAFKLPVDHGALVEQLTPGGPAADAGLKAGSGHEVTFQVARYKLGGDIITALDGRPIRRDDDLSLAIAQLDPGTRVTLQVWRDGAQRTVTVTLGRRPE